jgi:plasmid maintenance system antidote protein VapI
LEELLGISAEFWLNLQNRYEITILRNKRKKDKELA